MPRPVKHVLASLVATVVACLLPILAIHAQQQPPATAPPNQPTAKDVIKSIKKEESSRATSDPIARIKEEGSKRSQVMATLGALTDVIGPRLTGSPALKRANEWTKDKLAGWGLENAHLEAWGPFGRGWTLKRFSAQVVEPHCIPLIAYPKAWSPGTDGPVVAAVVHLDARTEADLAKYRGKLKGAIVLTAPPRNLSARFDPLASRLAAGDLLTLANASEPAARDRGRRRDDFARKKLRFLVDEKAAVLVDPSPEGDGGTIFVAGAAVPAPATTGNGGRRVSAWDKDAPATLPQVVLAAEHYNRLVRMIARGEAPRAAIDLGVEFHDDDPMAYNTIAEIPGTDLRNEVVMLGGHMDSWHSGTGATDNAAGISVAMEAVRILKALDLRPRRTIRIALWTGEEQGLKGSRAYVSKHFGDGKDPAGNGRPPASAGGPREKDDGKEEEATNPEFEAFSAYFNLDNGTGKVRGVYLQGNEAVRPLFARWLRPFREMGAATLSIANTGGTDHLSFDALGLPGFQFIQDPVEYSTRTHHSNQDVYDRIQADDMKQASAIMAAFVYNTAMRDEKLPRKPRPRPARPVLAATVDTSLRTADEQIRQLAYDGDPATYFASAGDALGSDHFTLVLDRPVALTSVAVTTGKPDGSAALDEGVLEVSADGKAFEPLAKFSSGEARGEAKGRSIRAIRVKPSADLKHPLAIRELTIESDPPVARFRYPVEFVVDVADAPEMKEWAEKAAAECARSYPLINDELKSDGHRPRRLIRMTIRSDYRGVAAAGGGRITGSAKWFKDHPEDLGAMIHETAHIVQQYHGRGNPSWLVEGVADYVRFFKYEPGKIGRLNVQRARYDQSYRVTAAFLAYLAEKYDAEIVLKLNRLMREGKYTEDAFQDLTGKTVQDLGAEWKASLKG